MRVRTLALLTFSAVAWSSTGRASPFEEKLPSEQVSPLLLAYSAPEAGTPLQNT
jgi:hypothetical protein